MKKILLLVSIMLSSLTYAQGHETFDNLDLTGNSYTDGTFVGQDGITWTFGQSRGDLELNGKAITLGRNRDNPMFLESQTLSTGIGTLQFSYSQAFSTNVGLEVLVNGELVYTATSEDELDVIKDSGVIEINVEGDVVITFNNPADPAIGQVKIDDIIWTSAGTVGIEDNSDVKFSYFPNPMTDVLNFTSNSSIVSVEAYNLLGQRVINDANFNKDRVSVSSLLTGAYIFKVKFENGTQKTFKVFKQ